MGSRPSPVPGAALDLADEFLDRVPDGRAGGQPVRQSGANQGVRAEQAELVWIKSWIAGPMARRGPLLTTGGPERAL